MPRIGITPCSRLADYEESVRRAGGEPRVLRFDAPLSLHDLDGVLLTGGGDIDPGLYAEPPHPTTKEVDAQRDRFEIDLARLAMKEGIPLLGICRGLQVMNVAAGGTLIQDIPSQVADHVEHHVNEPLDAVAHPVQIARGSVLARVMGDRLAGGDRLQVNSRHHQSIARVAAGFDVSATAPDGVIEAIERPDLPFCLAVQWHPENFWRTAEFAQLFKALCDKT